ncbi:hypothetical protein BDY21DRAFT_393207 [Lineolata rhizophorae]|uniref:Uncharacterized protein n=1 Tax=Lineolata rhizophorae TaxID=578093 RepID=A0A6A6NYS5_9PEZI|nr:hypothetical protein BDY21DRAFT_393207 [Lineolata rhizophorae]
MADAVLSTFGVVAARARRLGDVVTQYRGPWRPWLAENESLLDVWPMGRANERNVRTALVRTIYTSPEPPSWAPDPVEPPKNLIGIHGTYGGPLGQLARTPQQLHSMGNCLGRVHLDGTESTEQALLQGCMRVVHSYHSTGGGGMRCFRSGIRYVVAHGESEAMKKKENSYGPGCVPESELGVDLAEWSFTVEPRLHKLTKCFSRVNSRLGPTG